MAAAQPPHSLLRFNTSITNVAVPMLPGSGAAALFLPHASPDLESWTEVEIEPGDSLSGVFDRLDLPAADWRALARMDDTAAQRLVALQPGDELRVRRRVDGRLGVLILQTDDAPTIKVTRGDDGEFRIQVLAGPIVRHRSFAAGPVDVSLRAAAARENVPIGVAEKMTQLFGRAVDLPDGLRPGARFSAIYYTVWRGGERIDTGPILAAELVNGDHVHQAFHYTAPGGTGGYYDAQGRRLATALLRAPLDYSFISSPFDRSRMHPILGVVRPHLGIDYAAPTGTTVHAAGDGVVTFVGRKTGYGRVVIIRHGRRLRTLYAHMSGFAPGLSVSDRVSQGDPIGYVGETGLSTGPHLHYGVKVDDRFRDPNAIDVPRIQALTGDALQRYLSAIHPLATALESPGGAPSIAGR